MKINSKSTAIFNSWKINSDPLPWRARTRFGNENESIRYETEYDAAASQDFMGEVIYDPRPEFDNNPNPILEMIRSGESEVMPCLAYIERGGRNWPDCVTREHINHARKVLARLAEMEKAK